jgi:hypothetical protein
MGYSGFLEKCFLLKLDADTLKKGAILPLETRTRNDTVDKHTDTARSLQ